MKSFRMKKLWKAISLSLCGILTAGIIAGCGSENTVDKTTLKFGVTNFCRYFRANTKLFWLGCDALCYW